MKKTLSAAVFTIITFTVQAQVKGTISDTAKKPVPSVAVGLVIKSNPTDTLYAITNEKGEFRFDISPNSPFSIVFINADYEPFSKLINITKPEKSIDIGILTAKQTIHTLDEFVVKTPPIVIKEDTIEYNAASFKVKENAMVEDLLKKLPGIEVDRKTGDVKAQGKQVTKVKVNGKEFFGGDVQTATKELPANLVDKIQVIDDYGDQAQVSGIKDGDPEKVLNIQLKKDKNKGFFGRATLGAGTEERYQASFNGNYFNNNSQVSLFANSNNTGQSLFNFGGGNRGTTSMMRMGSGAMNDMGGMSGIMNAIQSGDQGFLSGSSGSSGISATNSIGTNYRDQWGKRVSVYGSYSYTHRNTDKITNTGSQNFYQNSSFNKIQDDHSNTQTDNHRFTFNLEWQADSFNYFKFNPTVNYSENNTGTITNFTNTDGVSKLTTSNGYNKNKSGSQTPNVSGSILFNHKFRKRGRNLSASLSSGKSGTETDQMVRSLTTLYNPVLFSIFQNQNIIQDNDNHNYGLRLTYTEPLNKYQSIDFTASRNLSYARNNKSTYFVDTLTNAKNFIQNLSNDYENNFYNNRVGVSLRTTRKKYNYSVGVSVLPVDLRGKSLTKDSAYKPITRVNVFPIARFAYNFSRSKALNFNYQGNATQPTFSQLQDVLDISNQQSFSKGNPNLKPAINHNVNLSYNNFNITSGKVIFTNLMFSTIKNQIVNNTMRRGAGLQTTIPENVNGYYNINGFYTFSKPFQNRKYVVSLNGTANFNHNINLIDSIKTIGKNWLVAQGLNFEFNYKEWLEFGLGVNYSINDIKYNAKSGITSLQNSSSNAWTFSSNINIDIPKDWVLKYDFDYTINNGLSSSISQNPAVLNASLEKQIFKKKNGILRLSAFDVFKQQTNVSRNVSANSIVDTRVNRLTRYFMLTFQYRLQKYVGERPQNNREQRRTGTPAF